MSDSEHKKEQAGHIVIREASKAAEAEHEKARVEARQKRASAHASLVTALAGLSDAGARYFAERVAEACYGSVAVNHRMLDVLEDLGLRIPAGFR